MGQAPKTSAADRSVERQRIRTMPWVSPKRGLGESSRSVSVVIPCYNQAHFLGEAIESVLSQTYPHFEIVVVDDGSTDNTSEVASRYEEVRLIRQENRGVNAARNTGIRHSEGEYVVFLDSDDRLLPRALEAGLGCFASHPECALVAGYSRFIEADGSLSDTLVGWQPPHIGSDLYVTILSRQYWIIPGQAMFRRIVFETVGLFDPELKASEDYEFYFRVAKKFPVYCYDIVVMEHRKHSGNTSRDAGKMLKGTVTVLRSQKGYAKRDERYLQAYRTGVRSGQEEYGNPLIVRVREQIGEGEWKEALRGAYLLARYYPRGLTLLINDKPLIQWRLEVREKEVRGKEWQLRMLRKELDQQRRQHNERTKQLRRLRKRNRRLEERERGLQWQLEEAERLRGFRSWFRR